MTPMEWVLWCAPYALIIVLALALVRFALRWYDAWELRKEEQMAPCRCPAGFLLDRRRPDECSCVQQCPPGYVMEPDHSCSRVVSINTSDERDDPHWRGW